MIAGRAFSALQAGLDAALVVLAWWLAFWLRFNLDLPDEFVQLALWSSPWAVVSYAGGLTLARVYRQVWSYIGLPELRQLAFGILLGAALTAAAVLMMRYPSFPRSVLMLQPLLVLVLLGAVRAAWRTAAEHRTLSHPDKPLVIVGSLHDAADALRALKGSSQWHPVAIVSPLAGEVGRSINNVRVRGTIEALRTRSSLRR